MDRNNSARAISIAIQVLPIITPIIFVVLLICCACCLCLLVKRRLHRPTLTHQNALIMVTTRGRDQTVIVPPDTLVQPMTMAPTGPLTRVNHVVNIDEDLPPPYEMVVSQSIAVKPSTSCST